MALPRYAVKTPTPQPTADPAEAIVLEEAYNALVNTELIAEGRRIDAANPGAAGEGKVAPGLVWLEVAYPGDNEPNPNGPGTVWQESGDAVEVDTEAGTLRTLTSEEWRSTR